MLATDEPGVHAAREVAVDRSGDAAFPVDSALADQRLTSRRVGDSRARGVDLERDARVRKTRPGDGRNSARWIECETACATLGEEIGRREKG